MQPTHTAPATRLALFPLSTTVVATPAGPELAIGGLTLSSLAETYETPLYLFDGATLDAAADAYRRALDEHYPGPAGVTYAGKAYLCKAIARWTQRQALWLDCTGVGEMGIAAAAGVPRAAIVVHGVNKSAADLQAAVAHAGVIVVDNLTELARVTPLLAGREERPDLWLRVRPGLAVDTHAYRQTGQVDSKFGMDAAEIAQGVAWCQAHQLPLTGLHFHQGSHFHDPGPIGPAVEMVLDLAAAVRGTNRLGAGCPVTWRRLGCPLPRRRPSPSLDRRLCQIHGGRSGARLCAAGTATPTPATGAGAQFAGAGGGGALSGRCGQAERNAALAAAGWRPGRQPAPGVVRRALFRPAGARPAAPICRAGVAGGSLL